MLTIPVVLGWIAYVYGMKHTYSGVRYEMAFYILEALRQDSLFVSSPNTQVVIVQQC